MSPIVINASTTSASVPPKKVKDKKQSSQIDLAVESSQGPDDGDTEDAREERRATGRSVAIVIFLSLMCLALYHVVQRKTTILAGVLVPALILFTYTFFVIHVSSRDKKRRKKLEVANDLELSVQSETLKQGLHKNISTVSSPSISSMPTTSSAAMNLPRNAAKPALAKSLSMARMDLKQMRVLTDPKGNTILVAKKVPPPFKKAQSQSHIQVRANQSTQIIIEHEKKKLKKSRSFDKNNYLGEPRHTIDNKKNQNKASSRPQKSA